MNTFTIFKVSQKRLLVVQWFHYNSDNLQAFGVEPVGEWYENFYPSKNTFTKFEQLQQTEHYDLLIQDQHQHDYFIIEELPPHIILLPNHKKDTDHDGG